MNKTQPDVGKTRKHRYWLALVMNNGTVHIREYLGSYNFRQSISYQRYAESPVIDRIVGPVRISVKVDHRGVLKKKAARPPNHSSVVRKKAQRRRLDRWGGAT